MQLDQYESLNIMAAGPGQSGLSPAQLPRPLGDDIENLVEAPPLAHPMNCPARYMRVTVSAIPSQQVGPDFPLATIQTALRYSSRYGRNLLLWIFSSRISREFKQIWIITQSFSSGKMLF